MPRTGGTPQEGRRRGPLASAQRRGNDVTPPRIRSRGHALPLDRRRAFVYTGAMATVPRTPPLIGRDRELAALHAALDQARRGRGGVAVLDGEPGIGKTRLTAELCASAAATGFLVAGATCYEGAWSPPFGLWSLAVGELGTEALEGQPAARLSVLSDVMPELRTTRAVEQPPALSPEEARFRATDAVTRLLLDVAQQRPLLVVADDLQWADAASLDVLAYLGRFVTDAPLLVLGAYRTGDIRLEHRLARALGELDRHDACVRVRLGSLAAEDAFALVESLAGTVSPELAAEIVREASGHPFFITEVVRHLLEEGADLASASAFGVPQSVRHAVATRLARLAPAARRVLGVAAAFTRPFEFSVLAAMTGLAEEELLSALDEALRAQLLRGVGEERYEFSHALVRRTLYDEIGPSRRARLHRRVAQALERVYAGRELEQAGELGAQYHASAALPGAEHGIRYSLAAAEQARAVHAPEQAVASLRGARDLALRAGAAVRSEVACRLAIAEAEAFLLEDAARSADEALALLEEVGADAGRVADFVVAVAQPLKDASMVASWVMAGGGREAVIARLVERGLAALGERRDLTWARLKLLERPKARDEAGPVHSGRWLGFDPRAVAIARSRGDEEDYARTLVHSDHRSPGEVRALLDRVGRWSTPGARIWSLDTVVVTMTTRHGAFREAADVASHMLAYSEEVGSLPGQLQAASDRAIALVNLGEFEAAAEDARRVDELLSRLTLAGRTARLPTVSMEVRIGRWQEVDWAAIARFYRDAALDSSGSPELSGLFVAAIAAEAFSRAGEPAEARQLLGWILPPILASEPTRLQHNGAVALAAGAVWELGESEHAAELRGAALAVIGAGVGDCSWTSNELTVARMSSLLGDLAGAERWFERARAALEAGGQRPLRAVVDYDEARHRLRHGLPAAAPLVAEARRRFEELEMHEWIGRANRLAAELGESHPDGLTDREVEVLRLLTGGLTNAEIAGTLVISVHTVERHLANAYRKIGARNRAEAAAYTLQAAL
jgi:DNA-binding CsgD family transcriptional regulator